MTKWYLSARDQPTLAIIGAGLERDMQSFTCIKRFNALGTWTLVYQDSLSTPSAHAALFLRDSATGKLDNGIYFFVDNEDGNGPQLVMSGPQLDVEVNVDQSGLRTITATGACDNYWLDSRRALQVPSYPYYAICAAIGVSRHFNLDDTSGTTAVDSANSNGGTYNGTFTLNQAGLIDQPPGLSAKFDGSTAFVSVIGNGGLDPNLPNGNGAWGLAACVKINAYGAGNSTIIGFGDDTTNKSSACIKIDSTGRPFGSAHNADTSKGNVILTGGIHMFAVTWDGTTMLLYVDGVQQGSGSGLGPLTVKNAGAIARIATSPQAGTVEPFNGWIAAATFFSVCPTAGQIQNLYSTAISRLGATNYDIRTGQASTIMRQYVANNGGASSLPTATFTSPAGTHSDRRIPLFTLAADPLVGSTLTGVARLDNLLDLLGALALQSSPELGFKLEQPVNVTNLVFTVFQPADKTTTAVFSLDRRNLLNYSWKYTSATSNHIFAGGSNPGGGGSTTLSDRIFGENEDSTSISQFGYREDFLDYRQAQDGPTLQQAISAQLASDARQTSVNCTAIETSQLYFLGPGNNGFNLGDKVTVLVDGQTFQEVIREVQIDLQPNQAYVVTPAIGSPIGGQILQEMQTLADRLKQLKTASGTIQQNF